MRTARGGSNSRCLLTDFLPRRFAAGRRVLIGDFRANGFFARSGFLERSGFLVFSLFPDLGIGFFRLIREGNDLLPIETVKSHRGWREPQIDCAGWAVAVLGNY